MPVILATWEAEVRRITVQSQTGKVAKPYLKNYTTQNRAGEVAQVVEHLPSKHEALSSNPSPGKKIKGCILCLGRTDSTNPFPSTSLTP
jgi:hypothetical protein